MKVFLIFAILITSACAEKDNFVETPTGEVSNSEINEAQKIENIAEETEPIKEEKLSIVSQKVDEIRIKSQRIASGVDALVGENLDFVLLTVIFYNQMQTCGGILVHPQYILTTATCVKDPVEGVASIINATFPQVPNYVATKLQIFIHESYNYTTYADNVALIKLSKPTIPDNKTVAIANLTTDVTPDIYVNKTLRLCGFGSIANYYTKPIRMRCTDMFIQPSVNCSTVPNTICSFWTDRDNNACNNDYGGALYLYNYNGLKINQNVVGMASYSPDYRQNAPCFGGQKIVSVNTAFYLPWINNIINSSPAVAIS